MNMRIKRYLPVANFSMTTFNFSMTSSLFTPEVEKTNLVLGANADEVFTLCACLPIFIIISLNRSRALLCERMREPIPAMRQWYTDNQGYDLRS